MLLIDAHVHIYECFNLQTFFDSTLKNFQTAAERVGNGSSFNAFVFLTDWARQNWFFQLKEYAVANSSKTGIRIFDWTIYPSKDSIALFARHRSGQGFYLIAGRKIITIENLEVLALATTDFFKDGIPLLELIPEIKSKGAIPVVPWAPGKWMGRRGRVISELLNNTTGNNFFLCDNGNRPTFWKRPLHFRTAEEKGIRILSGSDPLHFASEVVRAGSFGFAFQGTIDPDRPASHIKRLVMDASTRFRLYGKLESPHRFFRNQISMQVKKRKYRKELTQ